MRKKSSAVDLLAKSLRRRELETQREVWKTFGVDYETEKAKQQEIWNQLQRKRKKGKSHLQRRYLQKFLRALDKVDTQLKREAMIKDLGELAKVAHAHAMDETGNFEPYERLKWARIEAYIYQVINTIMRSYDSVEIKAKLDELKKMIKDELGKGVRKA